ncbi:hypothetical protein QAD02_023723 [Eretmocerus hayati]|uniref:Uncharacterized protein n=1 Tax=Eretmocerus hayati TaxID=131215 RepID=A0ACC2PY99_9HYME|nr:hypothetical protein QAD02_023723 [Eretmocerus hayati]
MDRWCGKLAVVTGAASGIGAAITKRLLDAGVNVAGLDIKIDKLKSKAEESGNCCGNARLHPIKCDLAKQQDVDEAFCWIERELGGPDVLVNNAGVIIYTPVIESDRASFEKLMNVNVVSVATCISKAVQSIKARQVEGHIFNINSVLGHVIPEATPSSTQSKSPNCWNLYPASKHAGVALTHTIRREISHASLPIRVTSISPGLVETDIANTSEEYKDFMNKISALDPNDIADAVIYALGTRPEVQITEMTIRMTGEVV